jgi:hypothetical protein
VAIASSGGAGAQRVATILPVAIASSGGAGAQRVAAILPGPVGAQPGRAEHALLSTGPL